MKAKLPALPEMQTVQKILFWTWLSALFLFSTLVLHQALQQQPWQSEQSWYFLITTVGLGILAFCLNSLLGIIFLIRRKKHFHFGALSCFVSCVWAVLFIAGILAWSPGTKKSEIQNTTTDEIVGVTLDGAVSPTPALTPTTKPKPKSLDPFANDPALKNAKWGEAVQIREHEYRMKVGEDAQMGTPQEIFEALNNYRSSKGAGRLEWNEKIAALARERVLELVDEKTPHEGFKRRLAEEGFWDEYQISGAGENASVGYRLSGVHLIEWMYASDAGHETNQLNSKWNCVGIAVVGENSVLVFCNR